MTPEQVKELVQADLAANGAASSSLGPTLGVPWSASKVQESMTALRASLVLPYTQRFHLKDTAEQMRKSPADIAVYWVVAETEHYLEFYDPENREYGLAMPGRDGALPETVGVRGDLIGVFGAM